MGAGALRTVREGSRHGCAKSCHCALQGSTPWRLPGTVLNLSWCGKQVGVDPPSAVCPLLWLPIMGQALAWPQQPRQSLAGSLEEAAFGRGKV